MHDRSRRDSAAPPALPAVPADAQEAERDPEADYFAELYSQNLCIRCGAGAEDASQYCGACADASWQEGEEEPC